jgi:hypothetical protein
MIKLNEGQIIYLSFYKLIFSFQKWILKHPVFVRNKFFKINFYKHSIYPNGNAISLGFSADVAGPADWI